MNLTASDVVARHRRRWTSLLRDAALSGPPRLLADVRYERLPYELADAFEPFEHDDFLLLTHADVPRGHGSSNFLWLTDNRISWPLDRMTLGVLIARPGWLSIKGSCDQSSGQLRLYGWHVRPRHDDHDGLDWRYDIVGGVR